MFSLSRRKDTTPRQQPAPRRRRDPLANRQRQALIDANARRNALGQLV